MSRTPTFADRLIELRTRAGLTQAALADLAGVSRQSISLLEIGSREPGFATVIKIARALNVSVAEFDAPAADPDPPAPVPPPPA